MLRDSLLRYPLFALLNSPELDAWAAAGQEVTFETGETIFQAGTAGLWAYVVLDGRVRVLRPGNNREFSLGWYGPGEVFGEYALVPPGENSATCRASSPCRLLRLPLKIPRQILASMPQVSRRLKDWMRLHTLVGYLRNEAFLGFMSAPSALKWFDHLSPVSFQPQGTIQADGLSEDQWFFIRDGRVAVHELAEQGAGRVRELRTGDCFGERALAGRRGLPWAVTLSDTQCLCLSRASFEGSKGSGGESFQSLLVPSLQSFPWVGQEEAADCGLAALAMIARFYDQKITVAAIRERVQLDPRGASLSELARIAGELGFKAQAVRIGDDQYFQVNLPAIVHCRDEHYLVLCQYGPAHVALADPATGMVRMHRELFHQRASGQLLLIRPRSENAP